MADRFERLLRQMGSRDPQAAEDAFPTLRNHVIDHVHDMIDAFHAERDDHGLRCWLLELIGEAQSATALPVLVVVHPWNTGTARLLHGAYRIDPGRYRQ